MTVEEDVEDPPEEAEAEAEAVEEDPTINQTAASQKAESNSLIISTPLEQPSRRVILL